MNDVLTLSAELKVDMYRPTFSPTVIGSSYAMTVSSREQRLVSPDDEEIAGLLQLGERMTREQHCLDDDKGFAKSVLHPLRP